MTIVLVRLTSVRRLRRSECVDGGCAYGGCRGYYVTPLRNIQVYISIYTHIDIYIGILYLLCVLQRSSTHNGTHKTLANRQNERRRRYRREPGQRWKILINDLRGDFFSLLFIYFFSPVVNVNTACLPCELENVRSEQKRKPSPSVRCACVYLMRSLPR